MRVTRDAHARLLAGVPRAGAVGRRMSWRTPRRGLTYSLSPAEAEEPSTLAELYVLKVPVDSGPPASADGQQLGPAAGTANRIIALLRGWFASSLPRLATSCSLPSRGVLADRASSARPTGGQRARGTASREPNPSYPRPRGVRRAPGRPPLTGPVVSPDPALTVVAGCYAYRKAVFYCLQHRPNRANLQ